MPAGADLFAGKLAEVEQQLAELTLLRDRMLAAMRQWRNMPDGTPDGRTICRLIEHWDETGDAAPRRKRKTGGQP